jgi:CelD/BcsL family acetyltransferase involved in cellulose biosynthesis
VQARLGIWDDGMRLWAIHPNELGSGEIARWRALRALSPGLGSPYFAPAFTQIIGAVRADARVVVIEDGGQIQGFLPVQRPTGLAAMALGAPISDYQGPIAHPDLPIAPRLLCTALKVGRIDFTRTPVDLPGMSAHLHGRDESFVARFSPGGGLAAYEENLRQTSPGTHKKQSQKWRKLVRERADVAFLPDICDGGLFRQLIDWNRRQCEVTRQPPVWSTRWVLEALDRIWAETNADFRPCLAALMADGQAIALLLVLRSGPSWHSWMIGHVRGYDNFSPGVLAARRFSGWAADQGALELEWGSGSYGYKDYIAPHRRDVAWGSFSRASMSGLMRQSLYSARAILEKAPISSLRALPGKAMRRLDMHRGLGLFAPRL